jgi:hypothetical protein
MNMKTPVQKHRQLVRKFKYSYAQTRHSTRISSVTVTHFKQAKLKFYFYSSRIHYWDFTYNLKIIFSSSLSIISCMELEETTSFAGVKIRTTSQYRGHYLELNNKKQGSSYIFNAWGRSRQLKGTSLREICVLYS